MQPPKHQLIKAQKDWLDSQGCAWVMAVFRAEGALGVSDARHQSLVSLGWTVDIVAKHFREPDLRFVCWIGGEPSSQVAPHIHALMEFPGRAEGIEQLRTKTEKVWRSCLQRKHDRSIDAGVWMREYVTSAHEELWYFERYEGRTFSQGIEKLLHHPLRLRSITPAHALTV